LLKKFWGPIPWMIEVAAIISFALKRWEDFVIITILLFVNIYVDYKQESKARDALEVLREKLAKKALVFRSGKFREINAKYLVPGDIIKLKIGDIIPADAKLLEGKYLEIDQSALTGESMPVDKIPGDFVYSNSIVKIGEMLAKVTKTGTKTYFGKSASLVETALKEEKSHFQKAVIKIGNFLILFTSILAIIVVIVSLSRGNDFLEVLQFILVLVVASIPVALPAVLSVTMAVGAVSIAKRRAIVSDLPAIEELAGINVLCTDKTGTLTQNKMTVSDPILYSDFTEEDLFFYAILASTEENKDPIERPIFNYFEKHFKKSFDGYTRIDFIPFDPIRKRTEAIIKKGKKEFVIIKGAPQVIIDLCSKGKKKNKFHKDVDKLAEEGYRTLAVAIKEDSASNFELIGLISLFDPPRKDSIEVIKKIKNSGIDIKMLTGDNHAIAVQIAKLLKIGSNILDVSGFKNGKENEGFTLLNETIKKSLYRKKNIKISKKDKKVLAEQITSKVRQQLIDKDLPENLVKQREDDIIKTIEQVDGFSQVMPEDKYFIIDKLQKANYIVAMTGDGVNDAPALKKADVGIAVSGATDAARAAADLILLSPGLEVINHAIKIARETFERMKAYAIFRIAETMRIILFMSISIIIFDFYPITALMIIVLALLNDIPVMMIAYDNTPSEKNPVHWNMKEVLSIATVLGLSGVLSSFVLFYWLMSHGYPEVFIQAMIFIKLDVAGHSTLYLTRTGKYHFWHKPFPSLKFFVPAFGSRIIGTLIAVYGIFMAPIGWKFAGYMWIYSSVWWILNDYLKVFAYKIINKFKATSSPEIT